MLEDGDEILQDSRNDLLKKWSLILGINPKNDEDFEEAEWNGDEVKIDKALKWVYGDGQSSKDRNFQINDWLKTIDFYFPGNTSVVIQKDAIKRHAPEFIAAR